MRSLFRWHCIARRRGKLSKSKIILRDTENNAAGYHSNKDMEIFLGKEGVTTTVLRPTGMAEFDGVRLNVVSEGELVQSGVKVRIVSVEGSRVLVRTMRDVMGKERRGRPLLCQKRLQPAEERIA